MSKHTPAILAEVRRVMQRDGITATELARRTGIAQPHISRALTGNPTAGTLQRMAEALGLDWRLCKTRTFRKTGDSENI